MTRCWGEGGEREDRLEENMIVVAEEIEEGGEVRDSRDERSEV